MKKDSKITVVTGGTSGIGAAICRMLAAEGHQVYALARHLPKTQEKTIRYRVCDVTVPEELARLFAKIEQEAGRIDLVCANAGMGISGAVEETMPAEAALQMNVNFMGAFYTAKAAMPYLRKTKGRLIFTSSVAGLLPVPFQAFYSASKAALDALTMTLANEVRPFGVSVCAVLPGDVHTGFTAARKKSAGSALYQSRLTKSVAGMEHDEEHGMTPEVIAGRVRTAAGRKHVRPFYVVGWQYRIFCVLGKLLPARLLNALIGKLYA